MRVLAIGDIHGSFTSLRTLLDLVQPQPDDRFIFLGDYIDSGPAPKEVLELLIQRGGSGSRIFLRGNHEVMILEARESFLQADIWQSYGGLETLFSYGANYKTDWPAYIPDSHWAFLESTVPFFETATHIFVHASLDPDMDMQEQPDRLLYWEYFDKIRPHKSGKKIICGHSPQRGGKINDLGFAACIDTGPAKGGWLTCLDVQAGQYWQANEKAAIRTGSLP